MRRRDSRVPRAKRLCRKGRNGGSGARDFAKHHRHKGKIGATLSKQKENSTFFSLSFSLPLFLPTHTLPQILETVLSFLDDPRDVASAARTCRRFAEAAASAPLRLGLSPPRRRRPPAEAEVAAVTPGGCSSSPLSAPLDPVPLSVAARVRALGQCWPGTTALSLGPGPPAADDAAVSLALRGKRSRGRGEEGARAQGGGGEKDAGIGRSPPLLLPRLAELRLDRCTKLTSAAFAEGGGGGESDDDDEEEEDEAGERKALPSASVPSSSASKLPPLSRLRLLGADRCFSLSADALTLALRASAAAASASSSAAAGPRSRRRSDARRLSSLALSHLDLSEWPPPPAKAPRGGNRGRSSRSSGVGGRGEESSEESEDETEEERESEADAPWSEAALSAAVDNDEATPEEGAALAWGDAGALHERRRSRSSKLSSPLLLSGGRGCRPRLLPSATTNLRCLALTNCSRLSLQGLEALCEAAPLLRVLALGGSSLAVSGCSSFSSSAAAAGALVAPLPPPHFFEDGTYSSSPSSSSSSSDPASALRAAHIGAAMAALASSRGAVAHVGSPGTLWPNNDSSPPPPFFPSSSAGALRGAPLAALRAAIVAEIGGGTASRSPSCDSGSNSAGSLSPPLSTFNCFGGGGGNTDSAGVVGSSGGGSSSEGALLSCCLRRMRRLRCVELTFWPRGTDSAVARALEAAAAAADPAAAGGKTKRAPVV